MRRGSVITVASAAVAPPPSAYPNPVTLPVAPHGDPTAARALATAYRDLADRLDATARQVSSIATDLSTRWHGTGSTALRPPVNAISDNIRTLATGARQAADHLDEYATALHKAQHHHGWSLTKIVAIGAVVAVTAVAVVVTVGAAAPVGTVAAVEVGEAIAGAEAAAGAATAAEASATAGLSLAGQTMTALRLLQVVALPHLLQGGISTAIDVGFHLATGRHITSEDLEESFIFGTVGSATTAAARNALRTSETFLGLGRAGQAAIDTAALTATLGADDTLDQYLTTGHINPSELTRDALLTALTGGAATLRHPLTGTGAAAGAIDRPTDAPRRSGTRPGQLRKGIGDLWSHEGPGPDWGHTLDKHVGQTVQQLRRRLLLEPARRVVSSFSDKKTAERAIDGAIRRSPRQVTSLLNGRQTTVTLKVKLDYPCGIVVRRGSAATVGSTVKVVLIMRNGRVVVRTAFVE